MVSTIDDLYKDLHKKDYWEYKDECDAMFNDMVFLKDLCNRIKKSTYGYMVLPIFGYNEYTNVIGSLGFHGGTITNLMNKRYFEEFYKAITMLREVVGWGEKDPRAIRYLTGIEYFLKFYNSGQSIYDLVHIYINCSSHCEEYKEWFKENIKVKANMYEKD